MNMSAATALADNLKRLMEAEGFTQAELAKRADIAQKTVSDVLNFGKTHNKYPSLRTIEAVANVFHIDAWQLQVPEAPVELLKGTEIKAFVFNYLHATDDGRKNLLRIAENEARYTEQNK